MLAFAASVYMLLCSPSVFGQDQAPAVSDDGKRSGTLCEFPCLHESYRFPILGMELHFGLGNHANIAESRPPTDYDLGLGGQ